jgi:hypothetical protein
MDAERYALYRKVLPDGTSKDWAIRVREDGGYTIRHGRTGSRLRAVEYPPDYVNGRAAIETARRTQEKRAEGYERVSAQALIDRRGTVHADPQPLDGRTLYWDCRPTGAPLGEVSQEAARQAAEDLMEQARAVAEVLARWQVAAVAMEGEDTLVLNPDGPSAWPFGITDEPRTARVNRRTGRGAGRVLVSAGPGPVLFLLALAHALPGRFMVTDGERPVTALGEVMSETQVALVADAAQALGLHRKAVRLEALDGPDWFF